MKNILLIMAVLVVPVMADEDDDFIGGVYEKSGTAYRAGSVMMTKDGLIFKSGSRYITQNGKEYQHVGSTYICPNNRIVTKVGSAFVSNGQITENVGSAYIGPINSFSAGSTMIRQGRTDR